MDEAFRLALRGHQQGLGVGAEERIGDCAVCAGGSFQDDTAAIARGQVFRAKPSRKSHVSSHHIVKAKGHDGRFSRACNDNNNNMTKGHDY